MASTAGAGSSSTRPNRARDEAGPLPPKVGELNYPSQPSEEDITEAAGVDSDLPAATSVDPRTVTTTSNSTTTSATTTAAAATTTTTTSASQSTTSLPLKHRPWYKRVFSNKGAPLVWGFRGPTLIRFFVLLLLIGGMSGSWAYSSSRVTETAREAEQKEIKTTADQMAQYMGVFIHVAFAVVILILLVFLERSIFVLRAEWWIHKHPGETLPLHHGGNRNARPAIGGLSAAPWNRPPLPTYAAALGYRGTGDVEDETIAAPPPPAYGNTRGSVLLLAGALRRISGSSATGSRRLSQLRSPRTPRTPREFQQIPESRPVSYISIEGFEDVQRAHQLEMSLARLEAGAALPSAASITTGSRL